MNVFVWQHYKKFHSYSMINEPIINNEFYTKAVAVVIAETQDEAIKLLVERNEGWQAEDLALVEPKVYPAEKASVILTEIYGS